MTQLTFKEYLVSYYNFIVENNMMEDGICDFSKDVLMDTNFPNTKSVRRMRVYLMRSNSCEDALECFEHSVKLWKAQKT